MEVEPAGPVVRVPVVLVLRVVDVAQCLDRCHPVSLVVGDVEWSRHWAPAQLEQGSLNVKRC